MGREEGFQVRFGPNVPGVAEGQRELARVNRCAEIVVVDWWLQQQLDGTSYHMQIGTENAPVACTANATGIDDQLAWMLADNNSGYILIPAFCEVTVILGSSGTLCQAMLEADKAKKRYSSAGAAFVPENLCGLDAASFNGVAYVKSADIIALAKSAVPDSVELSHFQFFEDEQNTLEAFTGHAKQWVFNGKDRPTCFIKDEGSLLVHHSATTGDVSSFGILEFVQLAKTQISAS